MLRALVCQQSSRDRPTNEALLATGFSPDEIAAMSHEARQAPVCDIMLRSPHLRRLSDTLSTTWAATQEGVKEVAATRRGITGWRTAGRSGLWNAHATDSGACSRTNR